MSEAHSTVVVGGGIAGVVAALLLSKHEGTTVTLIESGPELGGLLRSRKRGDWGDFDHGTHVLSETGEEELDHLLFAEARQCPQWLRHPHLIQEVVFGESRRISPFFDTRMLPKEVHDQALEELQSRPPSSDIHLTLEDSVMAAYGTTLRDHVFSPVMLKMLGVPLNQLGTEAQVLFGLKRLVIGTAEQARSMKAASSWNDMRIAYHNVAEGARPVTHFYPRSRGIGLWIEQIRATLEQAGTRIITNASIERLHVKSGRVSEVTLRDGPSLSCSDLIWSAPVPQLLRLAELPLPNGLTRPNHRSVQLVDLVLSHSIDSSAHYITVYEPSLQAFRITNYAALRALPQAELGKVTIEVLADPGTPCNVQALVSELMAMQLVSPDAKVLGAWVEEVNHGFPIITPHFTRDVLAMAKAALASLGNVHLVGRSNGRTFFMKDVLVDVWEQMSARWGT
jgi:protoporphyrinogen oxidase